jgi:excisionase family DNA binding protein
MSDLLSAHAAAARRGVSERTVRRWIKAGRLAADRSGGAYRVSLEAVAALAGQRPGQCDGQVADDGRPADSAAAASATTLELVRLVDRLQAELVATTAAAAMWQTRAEVLGQRLLALEAPRETVPVPGQSEPDPAPVPEPPPPEPDGGAVNVYSVNNPAPWWSRWWLWLMHETA